MHIILFLIVIIFALFSLILVIMHGLNCIERAKHPPVLWIGEKEGGGMYVTNDWEYENLDSDRFEGN